jgi:hypothetical protein
MSDDLIGRLDDTVFAWAWTLFGNGVIWQRRLTFTKDDPFAVDVAMSPDNFTSVPVALYTRAVLKGQP